MSWNDGAGAGATGWDNSGGGAASGWNDSAVGTATDDNNFGEAGGDSYNGGSGNNASGEGGAGDSTCRHCGQEGHLAKDCDQVRLKFTQISPQDAESRSHIRWEHASTVAKKVTPKPNALNHARWELASTAAKKAILKLNVPSLVRLLGRAVSVKKKDKLSSSSEKKRRLTFPTHQAAQCSKRKCKNCRGEGHDALECKENRVIDLQHIADKTEAEAWKAVKQASDERDIHDFKEAVQVLVKACPEMTYPELEKEFRKRNFNVYLIALEKDHGDTLISINLQGELGQKYVVAYFLSDKAQRPSMKERWPKSAQENLERLQHAGVPMDRGVEKCQNCDELGHTARACPQGKQEIDRAKVSCALCGADGHRARDCNDRPPLRAGRECRVCQSTEHQAKDCPNKEKRTCRNCGSEDHVAKECDQPRNPATIQCRNCDEFGHISRDCTAPTDWSKVKCNNCGEMGHTVRRCKEPAKAEAGVDTENGGRFGGEGSGGGGGGSDWEQPGATGGSGQPEWESNNAEIKAFGGGPVGGGCGW